MEMNEPQLWEELYTAAVLETDPSKVADRIDRAQDALRERLHTLCVSFRLRAIARGVGSRTPYEL